MSGKILFIVVDVFIKVFVYRLFHDCQLDYQ